MHYGELMWDMMPSPDGFILELILLSHCAWVYVYKGSILYAIKSHIVVVDEAYGQVDLKVESEARPAALCIYHSWFYAMQPIFA